MDLCKIDLFEMDSLPDINSRSFKEFCSALDQLPVIMDPEIYLEAVVDPSPKKSISTNIGDTIRATAKTTSDVGNSYGKLVNSNASALQVVWSLVIKCFNIAITAINFIVQKLVKVPAGILSLIERVEKIPVDIRNKVRGNIQLYITAEDIKSIYNQNILFQLHTFIGLAERFSTGNTWSTLFNRRNDNNTNDLKNFIFGENDMKLCKEMDVIYKSLYRLQFKPTTIDMSLHESRNLYFGSKQIIFNDLSGKRHEDNYLKSLYQLTSDINTERKRLDVIRQAIGNKYSNTQANSEFTKLSKSQRDRIANTIQMMSKIISVVGNMVRYIIIDIDTINKATNTLLAKDGIKPSVVSKKSKLD